MDYVASTVEGQGILILQPLQPDHKQRKCCWRWVTGVDGFQRRSWLLIKKGRDMLFVLMHLLNFIVFYLLLLQFVPIFLRHLTRRS
jgi:hypothetical protein